MKHSEYLQKLKRQDRSVRKYVIVGYSDTCKKYFGLADYDHNQKLLIPRDDKIRVFSTNRGECKGMSNDEIWKYLRDILYQYRDKYKSFSYFCRDYYWKVYRLNSKNCPIQVINNTGCIWDDNLKFKTI